MRDGNIEEHPRHDQVRSPRALGWEVNLAAHGIELLATLADPRAGSLMIPMDPRVAVELYEKLGEWIRTGDRVRGG